jgi:hypothetical protein
METVTVSIVIYPDSVWGKETGLFGENSQRFEVPARSASHHMPMLIHRRFAAFIPWLSRLTNNQLHLMPLTIGRGRGHIKTDWTNI